MRLTRIDDAEPVVHHCPRQQRPEARTDKSPLRRALPRHGPKSATRPLFSMAMLGCRYPRTESLAYRVAATCPITFKQLTRLNRDNAATTTTTTGSSSAEPIGRPNIAAAQRKKHAMQLLQPAAAAPSQPFVTPFTSTHVFWRDKRLRWLGSPAAAGVCVYVCVCVCVYKAVRVTGYTLSRVVRMHFCGSDSASSRQAQESTPQPFVTTGDTGLRGHHVPGVNDVTNVAITGLFCRRWQSVDSRVITGCGGRPQQPLAHRGHCCAVQSFPPCAAQEAHRINHNRLSRH